MFLIYILQKNKKKSRARSMKKWVSPIDYDYGLLTLSYQDIYICTSGWVWLANRMLIPPRYLIRVWCIDNSWFDAISLGNILWFHIQFCFRTHILFYIISLICYDTICQKYVCYRPFTTVNIFVWRKERDLVHVKHLLNPAIYLYKGFYDVLESSKGAVLY